MEEKITRGDVFLANLDPIVGHEQGGYRPVVVIQNDVGNGHSPTTIVAAITTADKPQLPTHVPFRSADGIKTNSIILCEQIRTLDKSRLEGRLAHLSDHTMKAVDGALGISVGIKSEQKQDVGMELCLCPRCLQNFKNTEEYYVNRTKDDVRQQCDYCGVRAGFTYSIKRKSKGGGRYGKGKS
jgi:mRNA interferase MazF